MKRKSGYDEILLTMTDGEPLGIEEEILNPKKDKASGEEEDEDIFSKFWVTMREPKQDVVLTAWGLAYKLDEGAMAGIYEFGDKKRETMLLKASTSDEVLRGAKEMILVEERNKNGKRITPNIFRVGKVEVDGKFIYFSIVERVRPLRSAKQEVGKSIFSQRDEFFELKKTNTQFLEASNTLCELFGGDFPSADLTRLSNWGINDVGDYVFLDTEGESVEFDNENPDEEINKINALIRKRDKQ